MSGLSPSMFGMQRPNAGEMSNHIMTKLDNDGDGALSTEEMGSMADRMGLADTDGDGLVSQDELVSKITEKMESMQGGPMMPGGGMPDINELKSILSEMEDGSDDSSDEDEANSVNAADRIRKALEQLDISQRDSEAFLEMLRNTGINSLV